MDVSGVQYAGEFDLAGAKIVFPSGQEISVDKNLILLETNIFEDIFSNSISGSIIVADTREVISKAKFMGQEKLFMLIRTPSLKEPRDIVKFDEFPLTIYKIPTRTGISKGTQVFELQFVSTHAVNNASKKIFKSYVNNKSNIGEIVNDLLVEELGVSPKLLDIEETVGNRPFLVQNHNPLTFISRLTKEAISKENGSSEYVFFSNKNGVHFKTLQKMFDDEIRGYFHSSDEGFETIRGPDAESLKIAQSYRRIADFELLQNQDLLVNTHGGMMGGKVIEHNLYRKKLETKTFNYFDDEDYKGGDRIDKERIYDPRVFDTDAEELINSKLNLISTSKSRDGLDMWFELRKDPNQRIKTILRRQSKITELKKGITIKLVVHGYTALSAGDMVFIDLQTIGGDDSDGAINKTFSGKYLIQSMNHKFDHPTRAHTMGMVVVKDGLAESISENIPTVESASKESKPFESSATPPDTTSVSRVPDSSKGYVESQVSQNILENDAEFQAKFEEMKKKYPGANFTKQKLYKIIKGESSFKLDAKNQSTNASGLFQFTPIALKDLNNPQRNRFTTGTLSNPQYTLGSIRNMSAVEQLEVYDQYLTLHRYNGNNELGMMQAAPSLANKSGNEVVYRVGTDSWDKNPGWRPSGGGDITVDSINKYYATQA